MSAMTVGRRRRLTRELEELRLRLEDLEAQLSYYRRRDFEPASTVYDAAKVSGRIARLERELRTPEYVEERVDGVGKIIEAWLARNGVTNFDGRPIALHLENLEKLR